LGLRTKGQWAKKNSFQNAYTSILSVSFGAKSLSSGR